MAAGQEDAEKLESWIDDTREKIFKVRFTFFHFSINKTYFFSL